MPALCNERIIVMEYVESCDVMSEEGARRVSRADVSRSTGGRQDSNDGRSVLANRLMDTFVAQLVYNGTVHGDPHPGNLGIDTMGRIVLFDFGNVIDLTDLERQRMKEMIYQLLLGNNAAVIVTLRKLGVEITDDAEMGRYIDLYRDYMRTIDVKSIAAIHGPNTKTELPLRLTDKIVRLTRVYGMLEGTCKALDPDFNYFSLLDNYIDELFFDEEFVVYKVKEDVRTLLSRDPPPVLAARPVLRPRPDVTVDLPIVAAASLVIQGCLGVYLLLERIASF
jgi:predicted unusual protein kinase regulating ubiquinone biosynthesis (AarF/ABC1/UbiB family)